MKGHINIEYDTETNKVMVGAPLSDQEQKDQTIRILSVAIAIVVNYKESPILKPGNGQPPMLPKVH